MNMFAVSFNVTFFFQMNACNKTDWLAYSKDCNVEQDDFWFRRSWGLLKMYYISIEPFSPHIKIKWPCKGRVMMKLTKLYVKLKILKIRNVAILRNGTLIVALVYLNELCGKLSERISSLHYHTKFIVKDKVVLVQDKGKNLEWFSWRKGYKLCIQL